jgi:UDP-glucose 4-epimerase
MSTRPVIVTGAGGYVGRAIASSLSAAGLEVLGIVHSPATESPTPSRVHDLEMHPLADAVEGLAPRAIVHCAASVPLPPQRADDEASAAVTRAMDANVADACALLGCQLIYMSSCILYDPTDPATKDEDAPVSGRTPYAAAKLAGERRAQALPGSVIIRIPSPVGGLTERRTVLDLFVERAVRAQPIEVWGAGTREQDFIHVSDIAGFVRSVVTTDGVGGIFNVASARPVTMRELAEAVVRLVGNGSIVTVDRPDPQEGHRARYDIGRAGRMLDWRPRVDLPSMIAERAAAPR